MEFDLEYLKKLAELVKNNNLSEITLENEKSTISIKREKEKLQPVINAVAPLMSATATSQVVSSSSVEKSDIKGKQILPSEEHKGKPIKSPMVGTFYTSPSPDEPPFVQVGDSISAGQIVCIIEAMKLMNEIEADVSGKITEICVKNGDSIEFGQVLMYVQ